MDSNKSTNTPINKALLEHCEDSLSKSLPSNNGFRRTTKEKSLAERRKSKLDSLFNKKENQTSTPSSKYSTPTARSQICSEDEYDDSFHGPYNPPETNLLLQNCYSSIANLREEVDSLRLRNHDFQNKLDAAEEAKRQLTLERNRLQQQLLQTSQDLSSQQSRAQSLNAEVDSLDLEIDKLKRENLRLRKLNFKSEEFQDKIYELETELNRSQRARKVLENKYSQLKVHHEKLRKDNKKLQVSIKRQNSDNTTYEKVAWLKESNEKLSQALHEVTSLAADPNHLQNQVTTLISVVKELSATNGRLKAEVMQCCDALSDYHGVHQVHPDGILLSTTSPKNDRPKKHRFNSLPFIKSTSKDSVSDNQDEPSPTIMNLFDDLKRALPEEISPKEMVKTLRHSASVGSGKLNSTHDFNQRDSGIYTTQSSLKQFYEGNNFPANELPDYESSVNPIEIKKETLRSIKHSKNRPTSLNFDFLMLSDVEESSPVNSTPSDHSLRKSRSIMDLSSYKNETPSIRIDKIPNLSLNPSYMPLASSHDSGSSTPRSSFKTTKKKNPPPNQPRLYEQLHESDTSPENFKVRLTEDGLTKSLPISLLSSLIEELMERLRKTEPKLLNRDLQRTFDMNYLVPLSNQLIQNILQNISLLSVRFQKLEFDLIEQPLYSPARLNFEQSTEHFQYTLKNGKPLDFNDNSSSKKLKEYIVMLRKDFLEQIQQFKDLISLIQKLLFEVANQRLASNDVALAFVDKMSKFSTPLPPPPPKVPAPHTSHWNSTPKTPAQTQLTTSTLGIFKASNLPMFNNESHNQLSFNYTKDSLESKLKMASFEYNPILDKKIDTSNVIEISPEIDETLLISPKRRDTSHTFNSSERNSIAPMMIRHGVVDYSPKTSLNLLKAVIAPVPPENNSSKGSQENVSFYTKESTLKSYLRKVVPTNLENSCNINNNDNNEVPTSFKSPTSPNLPSPSTKVGINTNLAHRDYVVRHSYSLTPSASQPLSPTSPFSRI